jgi:arylsulfatase A-like enzyme
MIVRWRGHLPEGRRVEDQVQLIDLMPTLLALAGIRERPPTQGRDIGALLRGQSMRPVPALLELLVDRNDVRALRTREEKTISWRQAGASCFYDLVRDPRELRPISLKSPKLTQGLLALDRAISEAAAFPGHRAVRAEVGDDLKRRLGILGYTEADAPADRAGK